MGDDELFRQEFLCEFLDESQAFLPHRVIAACEDPAVDRHPDWPALQQETGDLYAGIDVARRRDFTVIWLWRMEPAPAGMQRRSAAGELVAALRRPDRDGQRPLRRAAGGDPPGAGAAVACGAAASTRRAWGCRWRSGRRTSAGAAASRRSTSRRAARRRWPGSCGGWPRRGGCGSRPTRRSATTGTACSGWSAPAGRCGWTRPGPRAGTRTASGRRRWGCMRRTRGQRPGRRLHQRGPAVCAGGDVVSTGEATAGCHGPVDGPYGRGPGPCQANRGVIVQDTQGAQMSIADRIRLVLGRGKAQVSQPRPGQIVRASPQDTWRDYVGRGAHAGAAGQHPQGGRRRGPAGGHGPLRADGGEGRAPVQRGQHAAAGADGAAVAGGLGGGRGRRDRSARWPTRRRTTAARC